MGRKKIITGFLSLVLFSQSLVMPVLAQDADFELVQNETDSSKTKAVKLETDIIPQKGTVGTQNCPWILDSEGTLTLGPGIITGLEWTYPITSIPWADYSKQIKKIELNGQVTLSGKCEGLFSWLDHIESVDLSNANTSSLTSMSHMFAYCDNLTKINISTWDTSNVTNMEFLFTSCSLTDINLSGWDTSSVTNMQCMFHSNEALRTLDLKNFNTRSVVSMRYMFYDCSSLTNLDLSTWDTSSLSDMSDMFRACTSLNELKPFKNTSKVSNMNWLFVDCQSLENLDLSGWDTSKITKTHMMFSGCSSLKSLDVSTWNVSKVSHWSEMFSGCSSLKSLDVTNWNIMTEYYHPMDDMFKDCTSLEELHFGSGSKEVVEYLPNLQEPNYWNFQGNQSNKISDLLPYIKKSSIGIVYKNRTGYSGNPDAISSLNNFVANCALNPDEEVQNGTLIIYGSSYLNNSNIFDFDCRYANGYQIPDEDIFTEAGKFIWTSQNGLVNAQMHDSILNNNFTDNVLTAKYRLYLNPTGEFGDDVLICTYLGKEVARIPVSIQPGNGYKFLNFSSEQPLGLKYYTRFFDEKIAKQLKKEFSQGNENGFCSGISRTWAYAKYSGLYDQRSYRKDSGDAESNTPLARLGDVDHTSWNRDLGMTTDEYIAYAHVYQYLYEIEREDFLNIGNITGLVQAVRGFENAPAKSVMLTIQKKTGSIEGGVGHNLIAVSIKESDNQRTVLSVFDPNAYNYRDLTIEKSSDGTYVYSLSGSTIFSNVFCLEDRIQAYDEHSYLSFHTMDASKFQQDITSNHQYSESLLNLNGFRRWWDNLITPIPSSSTDLFEVSSNSKMYWVPEDDALDLNLLSENGGTLKLTTVKDSLFVKVGKNTSVNLTRANEGLKLIFDNPDNELIQVNYSDDLDNHQAEYLYETSINGKNIELKLTQDGVQQQGASEGECTVTLKGDYKQTMNFVANEQQNDLSSLPIQGLFSKYPYTGSAIKPEPIIKNGDQTLIKDVDYIISYENNIQPGTATIIISGKGSYFGTVHQTFQIFQNNQSDNSGISSDSINNDDNHCGINSNSSDKNSLTMFRLYNPNSGEHFYTKEAGEKSHLVSLGWKDEGTGWTAPKESKTPVYRLYNPNAGDHHYTMNAQERDHLVSVGWKYENIGWYSDDDKSVPLYRQYNPNAVSGAHNYTANKAENDYLASIGWNAEGIAWYGLKQ